MRLPSLLFCTASFVLLTSCSVMESASTPTEIYALPAQEGVVSPLDQPANSAVDTLHFARDRYTLSNAQHRQLAAHAEAWASEGKPIIIAAAASRSLPPDYARVLSERRAKSVRQALIELGINPATLHTTGYGNDAPALADGDVASIYVGAPAEPAPPPPVTEQP